jgi:putative glycosyltransferase (TIGR04348 family)
VRIAVATPAPRGSRTGNRVTALRWAAHLRALGHRVRLVDLAAAAPDADLLVVLHARRGAAAAARWRRERGAAPLVVALTGTDLYQDLPGSPEARATLALADRLVVLQARALDALPPEARGRTRVILQSANEVPARAPAPDRFEVCAVAHLREVKDPFLLAAAVRRLPAGSRVRAVHLGAALDGAARERALAESAANPRWTWLGEATRRQVKDRLAAARLFVLTSLVEGGANVVSEAVVAGVPILSSRNDGSLGLLGERHPGWFAAGDAGALAELIARAEADAPFRAALRASGERVRPLLAPAREREAWRALLRELPVAGGPPAWPAGGGPG